MLIRKNTLEGGLKKVDNEKGQDFKIKSIKTKKPSDLAPWLGLLLVEQLLAQGFEKNVFPTTDY